MRRRGCLIGVGGFFGLLLLCCVAGYFVGIPRFRDSIGDGIAGSVSTEVAGQIGTGPVAPGTYTLSVGELQRQLATQVDGQNVEDLGLSVDPQGLDLEMSINGQRIGYSGIPVARNGQVVMLDMTVDNDALAFVLPADTLGNAIESGVNDYFAAQGLAIDSLRLGDDEITLEAVPA